MTEPLNLPLIPVADLTAERLRLAAGIRAPRTLAGYASDWKSFTAWCSRAEQVALPAAVETVLQYLTDLLRQGRRVTTATRHASGIAHAHRAAGLLSPCGSEVRQLLLGAQRLRGEQPQQKTPIGLADLRQMCARLGQDPKGVRNRAVLLVGFATALRRSNLCALDLADVRFEQEGIIVRVRREKQDQLGRGRDIGVPRGHAGTCPVAALRAWLGIRGDLAGPLFSRLHGSKPTGQRLHPNRIGAIVKAAVQSIGLDPAGFAGHSLRAGFVTEAGERGAGELLIAAQTGHRSMSVLRLYFRRRNLFKANACAMLGL